MCVCVYESECVCVCECVCDYKCMRAYCVSIHERVHVHAHGENGTPKFCPLYAAFPSGLNASLNFFCNFLISPLLRSAPSA
jgi:hypothetical protein